MSMQKLNMGISTKGSRKFKLAFDARPAQGLGGGVGTYCFNIIKGLNRFSEKFDFVFIVDSKLEVSHITFPANSEFIYTRVGRNSWFLRDIWMQVILPRKLKRMGVHLFHQPDYIIPIWPTSFVLVSTFFDAIAFTPVDDRIILSRLRVKYLHRRGSKNADAIVTISDFSKHELLKHLDIESEKITTIWCDVSETYFSTYTTTDEVSCLQKLNFDGDFILYFGGFIKRKNVELLLEAFKIVVQKRNIKLVMVGKINDRIMQRIESLGLKEMVIVFGFAKEVEIKVLLSKCEVFVFPSTMEGFGLPVVEALASGAPVVCSKNGSLPEIGGDAVHYFEGSEPQKLAEAIFDVLDDSNLRERLRSKGPKRAQMFTAEQSMAALLKLYMHLLESKFGHT